MMYVYNITLSSHLTGRHIGSAIMTKAIHSRMLNKGHTHMIQINCLTTPRLSMWSSDVMCAAFEHGGKHMRTVFRAYNAPRYPPASARKVERSEFPPVSVL